jgi:adenylate cyclase
MNEIERKFLVKQLPDLSSVEAVEYERHFIFTSDRLEIRVQKKGEKYEFERKVKISDLQRQGQKFEITKEEFEKFKELSIASIIRTAYFLDHIPPKLSVKIYHGKYEGLTRAEVEFKSEEEANLFNPFDWMGMEITNAPLGKDSKLITLSEKEFRELLVELKD